MKKLVPIAALLVLYLLLIIPFTSYMRDKPFAEKLGFIPRPEVLKIIAADQKIVVADSLVMKVLFYFGSLVEKSSTKIDIPPDYFGIYKTIETTVKLDPYNMDAYYFSQAVLVWDVQRYREVNKLLEYGMKYRDWDFMLPFFAGFNYAYFLKDYQRSAYFYKRAGDLSGEPLYANLAGRYMYEARQTDLAIAYLTTMEKSAKNQTIKRTFRTRIKALKEVKRVEQALTRYRAEMAGGEVKVEDLVRRGFLQPPPVDPYGGQFYLTPDGRVRSTSNFYTSGGERR